jgi:hypothetical protein
MRTSSNKIRGIMDIFEWMENCDLSMCDGEWEHYYGVKIDTLDNPGWIVQIDIMDTGLEKNHFIQ